MSWIDIGSIDQIPVRGARVVKTKLGCIAVFRTAEDEVFATSDRCPHKGGPLSEGIVHGTSVTCPLHNWVFDLNSGEAQGADEGKIDTYAIRVENGRLMLDAAVMERSAA
ncbi:nitrite reductase small subunit NirD [Cognatishimia sp. D5M38]|uniref:Nitrite reductase small subunit NirD n=1 Tax=Cognatishimia coralii TaxID=3083254 RepID=A0ABU8QFG0_9RHOB